MDYQPDEKLDNSSTGEVILLSFKIYGSIFLVAFGLYTIVRPRFPLAYNFCNSVKEYNTTLARNNFGHIAWIWKNFKYSDDELVENCGLTATVFIRFLRMGIKIAAIGIFNSIYLIPVNLYGCNVEGDECKSITDNIERIGLGNLSQGNLSLLATTFAAYVIFGSTLYFIYNEFEWFTEARHKFLTVPRPDNYSIYVAHIPKEFRGDAALWGYFCTVFDSEVLEASVGLDLYGLEQKVANREKIVQHLEHALTLREIKSFEPTHLTAMGETIESIPFYTTELEKLNDEISGEITNIENAKEEERRRYLMKTGESATTLSTGVTGLENSGYAHLQSVDESVDMKALPGGGESNIVDGETADGQSSSLKLGEEEYSGTKPVEVVITPMKTDQHRREISELPNEPIVESIDTNNDASSAYIGYESVIGDGQSSKLLASGDDSSSVHTAEDSNQGKVEGEKQKGKEEKHRRNVTFNSLGTIISKTTAGVKQSLNVVQDGVSKSVNVVQDGVMGSVSVVHGGVKKSVSVVQQGAMKSVSGVKEIGAKSLQAATELIQGSQDGKVRDSGFVTFTTLTAKAQCVQMIHHSKPFTFYVTDAPLPKDVVWKNVGLAHKKQQIGYLVAQILTALLCLFWTIPVAFVSSFSEVESLKKTIPSLENVINANPWIQTVLAQLNPILLVVLKSMLPVILSKFCEREGYISRNEQNGSLLTKLALFLIIQIFFVPAISGSIFAALPEIIEDWKKIIDLLAKSVPGQAKSFIQYVIVSVSLSCGLEILRVTRVVKAYFRSFIGPNLSEKERNTTFMGLQPLTELEDMDFPMVFAEIVLYIMILLVYSCIAPIMSYVMLLIFAILLVTYQNQLIFIYSAANDQGGMLWAKMVKIILWCIFIAQITLLGIMTLKQSALSSTLLIPLICCTVIFAVYLQQQHYIVTKFLPSTICKQVDIQNHGKLDYAFLKGQYIQPALHTKILLPSYFQDEENNIENCENGELNMTSAN